MDLRRSPLSLLRSLIDNYVRDIVAGVRLIAVDDCSTEALCRRSRGVCVKPRVGVTSLHLGIIQATKCYYSFNLKQNHIAGKLSALRVGLVSSRTQVRIGLRTPRPADIVCLHWVGNQSNQ